METAFIVLAIVLLAVAFGAIEATADEVTIKTAGKDLDRGWFHGLNLTRRAFVIGAAVLVHFGFAPLALAVLALAGIVFWLVFESILCYGLKGTPFFVGTTAKTDILMRKVGDWLPFSSAEDVKVSVMLVLFVAAVALGSLIGQAL